MPTYEYECEACHHAWEQFQSIKAEPERVCPKCGKRKARRKIGVGAGILIGGRSEEPMGESKSNNAGDGAKNVKAAAGAESAKAATGAKDAKGATGDAKKAAPKTTKAAPKAKAPKATAAKKAAPKKAAGPKLSPTQVTLLEAIAKVTEPQGWVAAKKPEQKTVDALLKHKLVKKGKKDEKTKNFFVMISQAGKKFLDSKSAPAPKA